MNLETVYRTAIGILAAGWQQIHEILVCSEWITTRQNCLSLSLRILIPRRGVQNTVTVKVPWLDLRIFITTTNNMAVLPLKLLDKWYFHHIRLIFGFSVPHSWLAFQCLVLHCSLFSVFTFRLKQLRYRIAGSSGQSAHWGFLVWKKYVWTKTGLIAWQQQSWKILNRFSNFRTENKNIHNLKMLNQFLNCNSYAMSLQAFSCKYSFGSDISHFTTDLFGKINKLIEWIYILSPWSFTPWLDPHLVGLSPPSWIMVSITG